MESLANRNKQLAYGGALLLLVGALAWRSLAGPAEAPVQEAGLSEEPVAITARPFAAFAAHRLLPDLRVLEPSGFYVVDERGSGGDVRLKFTTTIWNAGPGPLEVRGREDAVSGRVFARQVFHTPEGNLLDGDVIGELEFEHRHGHLHLAAFARYELWSLTADGRLLELVAVNDKVGFCLMDNIVVDAVIVADAAPTYSTDCLGDVQGISPGYGDIYVAQLAEQDLVITDLPDGRYLLFNIANPGGIVQELSSDNNSAAVRLRITGDSVWQE